MYLWRIPDCNQYMSIDEVGNGGRYRYMWRYSACDANSPLKFKVSFSLKDKTVFFFSFYLVVNMYFEYISLCLFWNWLIYLMPIYCCFYVSWFCFTNWKQITGMKTCCLSNVKQTMHRLFYNSCYSLHLCFAVSALGDDFLGKKKKKKWYSFHCIYWYVTYYVLLCRIWSDVLWSLLVKWFSSESFQIMTKDKSSHKS